MIQKKQFIIICLLICAYSQVILLQEIDLTMKSNQKRFEQSWNQDNWQTTYSVYGWIKIDRYKYAKQKESTIFHLTSNSGFKFQNNKNPGDRALSCFLRGDNLEFSTYSLMSGVNNIMEKQKIEEQDMDKWIFIYQGYSFQKKEVYILIQLDKKKAITFTQSNIYHLESSYYKIYIGQSSSYSYFPGKIQRFVLNRGSTSFREDNFQDLMALNPNSMPQCPTVFTSCAFTGQAIQYCDNLSLTNSIPNFQSIYLPKNTQLSMKYPQLFQKEVIQFVKNVECLSTTSFITLLNGKFVKIEETEKNTFYQNITENKKNPKRIPNKIFSQTKL